MGGYGGKEGASIANQKNRATNQSDNAWLNSHFSIRDMQVLFEAAGGAIPRLDHQKHDGSI